MKKCVYCGMEYPDEATECVVDHQPLPPSPSEPEPAEEAAREKVEDVVIRTFGSHEAAQLAASNLQAHGIECWINADDCGGMYPNLTAPGGVRLLVHPPDAQAAIALLNTQPSPAEMSHLETEAVASAPPETAPPRTPASGQIVFGLIVGTIVGILLCLIFQRANELGTKTYYQYAANGKPDEAWIYRDGHLIELKRDRNRDGKWDEWVHYEHGRPVRSEYDNNFDGKPDEWWTFSDDGADTLQKDNDFNGVPDEFCTYKSGVIQECDMRPNGAKYTTVRELFQNGVLTEIDRGGDSNGNFKERIRYDPFFNPIGAMPINKNVAGRGNVQLPVSH